MISDVTTMNPPQFPSVLLMILHLGRTDSQVVDSDSKWNEGIGQGFPGVSH